MKKKITKEQIYQENGWSFETFAGQVAQKSDEALLPLGVENESNERDIQSNKEEEHLYPIGVEVEDD